MTSAARDRILVADDEPLFLRTTTQLLTKAGYECVGVADGVAALERLQDERFDLILSDLSMPGNLQYELLREGRGRWPTIPLIVVTGAPTLPSAVESVRLGIADYLLKPVKYDDLLSSVRRALAHARRVSPSTHEAPTVHGFPDVIGQSPAMQALFAVVERVARTDANVLITGESGTGKEVTAAAIHRRSLRADRAFQVIDCTAVPETLFESVLFGHSKGAFTGAVKDQVGLLSQADAGTAFFDEIGELPLPLQAKLLRVIQEQTFIPLGQTKRVQIDTRFICATNRDLELEVNAGRFRRDLFYRLAVIHLELPPLRDRGDDVVLLAKHFLRQLAGPGREGAEFSEEIVDLFRRYAWPGNIRELRNAVEHALAVSRSDVLTPADLPAAMRRRASALSAGSADATSAPSRADAMNDAEKRYLTELLKKNDGNVSRAARQADISRQAMHKLLKKYDLDRTNSRRDQDSE